MTGAACAPGDALIGLPSTGLHSNGYSLARRALEPLGLDDRPAALGGASVADVLLEPTVIYVRAVLELLRSGLAVHGLAHITGGGLLNLLRLHGRVGFADRRPAAGPARLRARRASTATSPDAEMWEVFNMGCGFASSCRPRGRRRRRAARAHHPGAARIGTVTAAAAASACPRSA